VDKNAVTIIILVGLVVAGTAVGMVYVESKQAPEAQVRTEGVNRQIERDQGQASIIEQQVLADKAKLAALRNNPSEWARVHASSNAQHALIERAKIEASRTGAADQPDCFDSDATYGDDGIYVRGSARTKEGAEIRDHCRLGQLVEFSCVENPAGSGRFIPEGKLIDCPSGSSCEDDACVR
jgi:hypothetical protein